MSSTNPEHQLTPSYFEQRMTDLGFTAEWNQVSLSYYDIDKKENTLKPFPVFKEHPKGIEIIPYTLDRTAIRIEKEGSNIKKNWSIIRLEKPIVKDNGESIKYLMPKGNGSFPLISPNIIEAFEKKQQIPTLFITEGYIKAWKGYIHGLHIIGLPSITHMKNKEKGTLHTDILRIITSCDVKRAVWLTDGDCLDITTKEISEKKDLYTRPANFYDSIAKFKQLLDDYPLDKFFFHVKSDAILTEKNYMRDLKEHYKREQVKGLDDVMVTFPENINEIIDDINSVSKSGVWFEKFNITVGLSKVRSYFHLNDVTRFYEFHCERRPDLKGKDFKFHGTVYHYNDETAVCEIKVPSDANNYFRVGDHYYKKIEIPNKHGQLEKSFRGRQKRTIMDDHGKDFCQHIAKYEEFCNVPNNTNFQPVINNCFNVYNPIEYQPDEEHCTIEECHTIMSFIHHIFGARTARFRHPKSKQIHEYPMWELGLDYLQLLYQRPAEKLPILCLVSKQNNTGKSTLGFLLKLIFGGNVAIVGNQDLAGDFNAHWATKLVVICDETKIDKQHVVEKVKSLSTANKITMNAKGKDHVEIDCFIKFIFITNNEDTFISINEDDIRYWVIKVPVIKEENPNILESFVEEIPAFLSYLNTRKLKTEKLNRMWFHPNLIRTDALDKVIANSHSTVKRELRSILRQMFMDFGVSEVRMTATDIKENFFKNKELSYIERVLKDEMGMMPVQVYRYEDKSFDTEQEAIDHIKEVQNIEHDFEAIRFVKTESKVDRYSYPRWDLRTEFGKAPEQVPVMVKKIGRPYIFRREDYISDQEITIIPDEIANVISDIPAPVATGKSYTPVEVPGEENSSELPFR